MFRGSMPCVGLRKARKESIVDWDAYDVPQRNFSSLDLAASERISCTVGFRGCWVMVALPGEAFM